MDETQIDRAVLIRFRAQLTDLEPTSRAYLLAMARDILETLPRAEPTEQGDALIEARFSSMYAEIARRLSERGERNERDAMLLKVFRAVSVGSEQQVNDSLDLSQALDHLHHQRPDWFAAFTLREREGYSHDEVAAELGIGNGAARNRVREAKRFLRGQLGDGA